MKRISSILDSEYPKKLVMFWFSISKKLWNQGFFLLFRCSLYEIGWYFHIETNQKC